jgi:hypothetical protein
MKTKILIAAAAAASAAFIAYLVKRSRSNQSTPVTMAAKRSHHLTNVFAQAKNHKVSTE